MDTLSSGALSSRVVTASVDWCEANYATVSFIAEFYNTVSSLAIVTAGLLGILLHRRWADRLILLSFASVALVGLGSVAFHATLRFEHQMLDELPMFATATLLLYALFEPGPVRRHGLWLPLVLGAYTLIAAYGTVAMRGELQSNFFQGSFTAMEFYALYRVYRLQKAGGDPMEHRLFMRGIVLYAIAIVCWILDFGLCDPITQALAQRGLPYIQLHAFWHLCVAGGFYYLVLTIALARRRLRSLV